MNIGLFSSVQGPESLALIDALMTATRSGIIKAKAKVLWVFCNGLPIETTEGLREILGVDNTPLLWCDSGKFKPELRKSDRDVWGELYDEQALLRLQSVEKPDIIVFVGYMLIVSSVLCDAFRMLNLHPATLGGPKGAWRVVTQKVVDQGLAITGTRLHWVTEGLDAGPVVSYCVVNVEGCDFTEVRRRQFEQEIPLLILTLAGLANGTIKIGDPPVDLTKEVEEFLRENSSTI